MGGLAWKNLVREKTRLVISVGGVAFAVLLILLIQALYTGLLGQATSYIESVDADIWVAQADTPGDFFHSISLLPAQTETALARVPGVERATPLVGRPVVFTYEGKTRDFFLLGVDPRSGIGGPPSIVSGDGSLRKGEIVIDRVFAHNTGIGVGDALDIRGVTFEVTGIAKGGNAVTSQFAWTSLADSAKVLESEGVANYFLIGTDAADSGVAERIERSVRGTKAMLQSEFIDENTSDLREGFLPIVYILVLVAFSIGTVVIGLTIYTATLEKRREYGVLKAIGFSNRRLLAIVFSQSLVAGVLGLITGVAATFAFAAVLERILPSFVATFRARDVAIVTAAVLLMSILSSFVPARPVVRLDPSQVFRV